MVPAKRAGTLLTTNTFGGKCAVAALAAAW